MAIMRYIALSIFCFIILSGTAKDHDRSFGKPDRNTIKAYNDGLIYEIKGDYENAIKMYSRAIYFDSTAVEIYGDIIRLYSTLGLYSDALQYMEQLLNQVPDSIELRQEIADIYSESGFQDEAIPLYERLIVENPNYFPNYIRLAKNYFLTEQDLAAMDVLKDASSKFRDNYNVQLAVADLYLRAKKFDEAISAFRRVLRSHRGSLEAHYGIAIAYEMKGDLRRAERSYRRAFAIRTPNEEIFLTYLAILARRDKMELAISELTEYIEKNGPSSQLYQRLGFLHLIVSSKDKALHYLKETVNLSPKPADPILYSYIADIYADIGIIDSADHYWRKILDHSPNEMENLISYLAFLKNYGDTALAMEKWDSLYTVYPESSSLDNFKGLYYYELEDYKSAIEWFSRSLRKSPHNPQTMFILGDCYEKLGNRDKVIRIFSKLYEIIPESAPVQNYLGYVLAEENIRLDEARILIAKALEQDPNNGAYLDSYAWVLYRLGDYEKALHYINKAIEQIDDDPLLFDHKADILLSLGQDKKARDALKTALELASEEGYRAEIEKKIKNIFGE